MKVRCEVNGWIKYIDISDHLHYGDVLRLPINKPLSVLIYADPPDLCDITMSYIELHRDHHAPRPTFTYRG